MAAVMYATRYKCDLCGIEADGRTCDVWTPMDMGLPDGWVRSDASLRDFYGHPFREFCDQCAALPLRDILHRIKAGQVNA